MATGDAVVNPEELVRFAQALHAFDQELLDGVARLRDAFGRVSQTWRDQQQQRFAGEFDQMTRLLAAFHRSAEGHIRLLHAKAGKAQDYLDQ